MHNLAALPKMTPAVHGTPHLTPPIHFLGLERLHRETHWLKQDISHTACYCRVEMSQWCKGTPLPLPLPMRQVLLEAALRETAGIHLRDAFAVCDEAHHHPHFALQCGSTV